MILTCYTDINLTFEYEKNDQSEITEISEPGVEAAVKAILEETDFLDKLSSLVGCRVFLNNDIRAEIY